MGKDEQKKMTLFPMEDALVKKLLKREAIKNRLDELFSSKSIQREVQFQKINFRKALMNLRDKYNSVLEIRKGLSDEEIRTAIAFTSISEGISNAAEANSTIEQGILAFLTEENVREEIKLLAYYKANDVEELIKTNIERCNGLAIAPPYLQ